MSDLTTSIGPVETMPLSENDGKEAPVLASAHFDPAEFTHEAAAILSSILRNAEYECAKRIPQAGGNRWYSEPIRLATYAAGGVNCWKESPCQNIYSDMLKRGKGLSPVILFDLFFFHRSVTLDCISQVMDENELKVLEDAGILHVAGNQATSKVRCYPVGGLYFLCDPSRDQGDFVYIGWDSDLMVNIAAKYCKGRRFSRSLDLCTGSGVQGICLSRQAEEAICADINPRALAMVQANALLNKIQNVGTIHSDLFSNIPRRFDCITANTPYVPHPEGAQLPIGGGDIGIEFTIRLLLELPERLTDNGIAVIYTSDPIVRGKRQLISRVTAELGHLPFRIILIPLFTNNYPFTKPMQEHYDRLGLSGYDDCILVIERGNKYTVEQHQNDWFHYYRTRVDAWLDWRRRAN